MNIITIDCGASFIKGALFQNGEIVKRCRRQAPGIHRDTEILNAVQIELLIPEIYEMMQGLSKGLAEAVLCISNEMHGFLLAGEDGSPYTDYISWQHAFGAFEVKGRSSIDILQEGKYTDDILDTGMHLRAGLPVCGLLYLSRCGYLKKAAGKLFFYTLGDYILRRLSGQEPECHSTNAAATGLYDLRTGKWNEMLVQAAGAEEIIFPDIGTKTLSFELDHTKITALPAVGDQQAALYGAGLRGRKEISFNIGTGAQVSTIVYRPDTAAHYQIRPYFGEGVYLKTIPHIPSGRALNVYIRFIKDILEKFALGQEEEKIWEVLLEAEANVTSGKLKCDMSFFENAVTGHTSGSITEIEEYGFTLGSLMHAVFRQMADNFIWAADKLETDRASIGRVFFSGGIAGKVEKIRSNILEYFAANVEVFIASDETLNGLYLYGREWTAL